MQCSVVNSQNRMLNLSGHLCNSRTAIKIPLGSINDSTNSNLNTSGIDETDKIQNMILEIPCAIPEKAIMVGQIHNRISKILLAL